MADVSTTGIKVEELADGRSQYIENDGDYVNLSIKYKVSNVPTTPQQVEMYNTYYETTTEHIALMAVKEQTKERIYGLKRNKISIVQKISETEFFVQVDYGYNGSGTSSPDDDRDAGDRTVTFNGNIAQEHITTAEQCVGIFGNESYVSSADLSIQCEDGNVVGTDIIKGALSFTETHYFTYRKFTIDFLRTLTYMQGKVNNAMFRGFLAGEVRFDSFSARRMGSKRTANYEVTFNFSVRSSESAQTRYGLSIPAVDGWDVICPCYVSKDESDKHNVTKKIVAGRIFRIYPREDFSQLGIKTSPFNSLG